MDQRNGKCRSRVIGVALSIVLAMSVAARSEPICTLESGTTPVQIDGRTFVREGEGLLEVASPSLACLSCHDGTIAPGILANGGERRARQLAENGVVSLSYGEATRNHPVDVMYPTNARGYVRPEMLDPRVELDHGLVTCNTCHSGNGGGSTLSVSNAGSRLCLSCHDK